MKQILFEDIKTGEYFKYNNGLYMKTCNTTNEHDQEPNCTEFKIDNTTKRTFFKNSTQVTSLTDEEHNKEFLKLKLIQFKDLNIGDYFSQPYRKDVVWQKIEPLCEAPNINCILVKTCRTTPLPKACSYEDEDPPAFFHKCDVHGNVI